MRVLVACEFSGIVRDAFASKGHDAWSCDLLPTERSGQHIEGDVLNALDQGWDLMIAHPPCQYLSVAGNAWLHRPGRLEQREKAMEFFMQLYSAPIPKVCVENPVGYPNTIFRRPDQIIHPYYFGDPQKKRTCLWLRGLPPLIRLHEVAPPEPVFRDSTTGKARYATDALPPSPDRWKIRSRTYQGIADAMAAQWG